MFNDLELHGNHFVHTLYITVMSTYCWMLLQPVTKSSLGVGGRGGFRTASELTIDLISLTVSCLSWKEVECQNCWVWCKGRTHAGEWVGISMWYCYAIEKSCSLDRTSPLSCTNLHIPWQQQQRHLLSEYKKADQKLIWFVGVGACGWLMRQ
jgi:hypothetical protein